MKQRNHKRRKFWSKMAHVAVFIFLSIGSIWLAVTLMGLVDLDEELTFIPWVIMGVLFSFTIEDSVLSFLKIKGGTFTYKFAVFGGFMVSSVIMCVFLGVVYLLELLF